MDFRRCSSLFYKKLRRKILLRGKKNPSYALSRFLFFFFILPNASQTWEDRKHFEEKQCIAEHSHTYHTQCISQIQHCVYSLGGVFQSKIAVHVCVFDTDSKRWSGLHWCILTEIDCSICGSIFSAPQGPDWHCWQGEIVAEKTGTWGGGNGLAI